MDNKQLCLQMDCQEVRAPHNESIYCGIWEIVRQTAKHPSITSGVETRDKGFDRPKGQSVKVTATLSTIYS